MFLRKTAKLLYFNPIMWKKIFLFKKNPIFRSGEKIFFNRSSIIPKIYQNLNVQIYSGKKHHLRFVSRWMVGFKFGEFTWNRKVALYKAKQLRKKKKITKFKTKPN
jgi:ribosomal protein S19